MREAIRNANAGADVSGGHCAAGDSTGTTIVFGSSVGAITLASTLPAINSNVIIDGGQGVTISGNKAVQVMFVSSSAALTLNHLTIANGKSAGSGGGGINNAGVLTITNSTVSDNSCAACTGGAGIFNSGTLSIFSSTVSGNFATGNGGGINNSGTLSITNSTFSANTTNNVSGGIFNSGTLTVTNSTFAANATNFFPLDKGGGIYNDFSGSASLKGTILISAADNISSVSASPNVLWPPNHKLVPVQVAVSATDTCDPNPICKITGVSANEPIRSTDIIITGPLSVSLAATREGAGSGRIYTVQVQCTDASGNTSAPSITTVSVPHG